MAIRGFTFDPVLTRAFVRFGYELYQGDANWIPPFAEEIFTQLSPDFWFYRQPGNAHRHFVTTVGGRTVGRISATVNRELKDRDGTPLGCVGFFESVDDPAVAVDLLDAAVGWLREAHGLTRIWGPMNFDIWHGYRFMTRGFGEKLFCGEPYNKPCYPDHFRRYGFTPKCLWNSVEIAGRDTLRQLQVRGAGRWRELSARGYRIESFDLGRFRDELRKLYALLIRSFSRFMGFTPVSFPEFERLSAPMRRAVHPGLFQFAYDEGGTPCGFAVALLELSDAIRAMNGRGNLLARARFAYHRRRAERIMFHLIGLTPEESFKRNGLGRALFAGALRNIVEQGYETCLITLMAEDNPSRGLLEGLAAASRREYTLFELNR